MGMHHVLHGHNGVLEAAFEMTDRADLTVVILTFNEEIHIERCLKSAFQIASQVFVVDSFSTDKTVAIAEALGARVWQHEFTNHAAQLAWALVNLPIDTQWVMRVDGDEVISPELAENLRNRLANVSAGVNGFLVCRYVRFLGGLIRHGNFPQWNLRIWRRGQAEIEQRWMDEHMLLKTGRAVRVSGEFIDDNLNTITWWTNKHNRYASREAIDLLNLAYRFLPHGSAGTGSYRDSRYKRWIKEQFYARLPLGLRAFAYFIYRMIFRLGFLDGRAGFVFHFLQGFWYRYLVDVKVWEVERRMREEGIGCVEAIRRVLGVNLTHESGHVINPPR
jgi:glycosyltransferase involved in cell wall biosynthesis